MVLCRQLQNAKTTLGMELESLKSEVKTKALSSAARTYE
jgi:hypothetical protein